MKHSIKIQWTALILLVLGLLLGIFSGLIERVALSYNDGTFVHYCAAISGKLFTIAVVFLALFGFEIHRARTLKRIQDLEKELAMRAGDPSISPQ